MSFWKDLSVRYKILIGIVVPLQLISIASILVVASFVPKDAGTFVRVFVWVSILGGFVGAFLCHWFVVVRGIIFNLKDVSAAAVAMRDGNWSRLVDYASKDEIGYISWALRHIARAQHNRTEVAQELVAQQLLGNADLSSTLIYAKRHKSALTKVSDLHWERKNGGGETPLPR
jgi:signal transduction histidine kinase